MLNHIRADMYRIVLGRGFVLLAVILTALTLLALVGLSSRFSAQTVFASYPAVSLLLYLFLSVVISDYTLREELQLKVLKNDMTTGISRGALYAAKYVLGALLLIGLWLIISAATSLTAALLMPPAEALDYSKSLVFPQQLLMLLQVLFCLGLFQLVGLFVQKTILVLLFCVALQQVVRLLGESFLVVQDVMLMINSGSLASFAVTAIAILAIVFAGALLFKKKEL
jgi:hypothetical protein